MDAQPEMVRLLIRGAEDLLRFRRQRRHALAAPRAGADQHHAANQFGFGDGQSLCDEASQRKAEHVDLGKAERLYERSGVGGHLLDGGWDLARTQRDTGIVEQDDLAILAKPSVTAGSQWSIVPVKWMLKTSGAP